MGLEECRLGMGLEERRLGMDLEECTYKNFAGVWRFFGDTCEQCHRDTWYSTCDTHGIRRSPPGGIARVAPRHPPQPAADHGGRPPHQTFACTKLSRRNGGHPPPSPRLADPRRSGASARGLVRPSHGHDGRDDARDTISFGSRAPSLRHAHSRANSLRVHDPFEDAVSRVRNSVPARIARLLSLCRRSTLVSSNVVVPDVHADDMRFFPIAYVSMSGEKIPSMHTNHALRRPRQCRLLGARGATR